MAAKPSKTPTARMPAAEQRRLNALIDRSKTDGLTAKEQLELERLLDEVDRKSFWMLARKLVQSRATRRSTATA